jgi:hypothetical protein
MAGMRRFAPHGSHAPVRIVCRGATPHYSRALMALVVASPQIGNHPPSACSPLEGDCRPSRADMTEPGPQGPGFFLWARQLIAIDGARLRPSTPAHDCDINSRAAKSKRQGRSNAGPDFAERPALGNRSNARGHHPTVHWSERMAIAQQKVGFAGREIKEGNSVAQAIARQALCSQDRVSEGDRKRRIAGPKKRTFGRRKIFDA